MRLIQLAFDDHDTMPEQINVLAAKCEITPDQLVKRAIAQYLNEHLPLSELPKDAEPPQNLRELFIAHGLTKQ